MEFRTTQGGETTLIFNVDEENEMRIAAGEHAVTKAVIARQLERMLQANPLADFTQLMAKAFPSLDAGVAAPKKPRRQPPADPSVELEQHIRRRLAAGTTGPIGTTSQSQQAEAILLQALAVCLQTQMLREMLERLDKPPMMPVSSPQSSGSVHG